MRTYDTNLALFAAGVGSALTSLFVLVLAGTYTGIGALTHKFGPVLIFAAPAQVILITALSAGSPLFEVAIASHLERHPRVFPMVMALLPVLRGPKTRTRELVIPTHFTSVSMWVESLRILASLPFERRARVL